jgi:hypothetical protein
VSIWKKTKTDDVLDEDGPSPFTSDVARRRAGSMRDAELLDWMETSVQSFGLALDNFRYHDGELEEMGLCLATLAELYGELRHRRSGGSSTF